ncbi:MAG TPA: potassium-transporting ATPase subunit KdpA, partial [Burkholderiaceae bacterium]|nr:potassium-transporting ATPase subunit KdpA [Burkholderiaceae bacterium]
MNLHSLTLLLLFLALLVALSYPLGRYVAQSMQGDATGVAGAARKILGPVEKAIYRLCGVRAEEEMAWPQYTYAILLFSVLGVLAVYGLQRLQAVLPLNPQAFGNVSA